MIWIDFPTFAYITIVLWILGNVFVYIKSENKIFNITGNILYAFGIITLVAFATILWIQLERPPMRTLGETRLWYSIFLSIIGFVTFIRWKYKWLLTYSTFMALLFVIINLSKPETYSKTLMPALQSPWFVPHVIVYIIAYALLAVSCLVAVYGLYQKYFKEFDIKFLNIADNMVYIGFSFLTFGIIFGALWAKEAWGHYWTWDPKETWAFLTWISYLIYMHYRYFNVKKVNSQLWMLSLAFVVLLICWFGINYLPSAQNSVHVYSN
jgi:ABC-type transport system involved in cytochrome c biogenesis permease subunit